MTVRSDLERLSRPFPASMIQSKPGKFAASYVAHSEVVQKLLSVVGPFDFAVTEIVRGPSGKIEGCLASLTVDCLLYTSPSPRDATLSRMPSSA